jgi:hypothetical protein
MTGLREQSELALSPSPPGGSDTPPCVHALHKTADQDPGVISFHTRTEYARCDELSASDIFSSAGRVRTAGSESEVRQIVTRGR